MIYKLHIALTCTLLFLAAPAHADEPVVPDEKMQKIEASAVRLADLNFRSERAQAQRTLEDLLLLFPDIKISADCTHAALSNYVENQWSRIAKEHGCTSDDKVCAKDPEGMYDRYKKMYSDRDEFHRKLMISISNMFIVLNDLNVYLGPVEDSLVPNNELNAFDRKYTPATPSIEKISSAELKKRMDEIQKYLSTCKSLQPPSWSTLKADLPQTPPSNTTQAKQEVYARLTCNLLGHDISSDKRGFVGCLRILNRAKAMSTNCRGDKDCIETVPKDNKDDLMRQLEDLKAHGCTDSYATQLARQPLPATASPPK